MHLNSLHNEKVKPLNGFVLKLLYFSAQPIMILVFEKACVPDIENVAKEVILNNIGY